MGFCLDTRPGQIVKYQGYCDSTFVAGFGEIYIFKLLIGYQWQYFLTMEQHSWFQVFYGLRSDVRCDKCAPP